MWQRSTVGLMAGSILAGFGGWIDFLAILTLAAYEYRADAFLMALISAAFLVPGIVLAPRVGRWIDRGRADAILLSSLVLRCIATASLLLVPAAPVFCLIVAVRSALTIPTEPASNVLVTRLVSRADVPGYFGMLGVFRNLSKIVAPTIGAAVASQFGEARCFYLSIALTLLGAGFIFVGLRRASLRDRSDEATVAAEGGAAPAPVAGKSAALLRQLIWTVTLFVFMVFLINNQLPVLLRNAGFDKALLGVLVSCSGAGGILAAAYMTRGNAAMGATDPMRATIVAVLATAACFLALGLAFTLPAETAAYVAGALFFCTGMFGAIEAIRSNTVIVQHFPTRVGAVSAKLLAYQSAAMLAAPWVAAAIIPLVSMPVLFMIDGGLALVGLSIVSLRFRRAASESWAASTA